MNVELLYAVLGILAMLLVDQVLGIARAVKLGTFKWSEIAATIENNVLPYVVPVVVLGLIASLDSSISSALTGVFGAFVAAYTVKLIADITEKIKALYEISI
ncbi:MAG: hypothetical protein AB1384_12370 [Actinomycetota bacterium]